jgi:hypothetical protein
LRFVFRTAKEQQRTGLTNFNFLHVLNTSGFGAAGIEAVALRR